MAGRQSRALHSRLTHRRDRSTAIRRTPPGPSSRGTGRRRRPWRDLCASHRNACQRAYDQLCVDPQYVDGYRWIRLAGRFAGIRQHEIGGGQRIWYRIEDGWRVVIVVPYTAHPKPTE